MSQPEAVHLCAACLLALLGAYPDVERAAFVQRVRPWCGQCDCCGQVVTLGAQLAPDELFGAPYGAFPRPRTAPRRVAASE